VDDEYPARAELRYLLQNYADRIEVVGEAAHAAEAKLLLNALSYDVLFLDIDMPGFSWLDLAKELRDSPSNPAIIFVTAYDQYAVQAFEVNAADYLLKPFDAKRLHQAFVKVLQARETQVAPATPARPTAPASRSENARLDRLIAERKGKTVLIDEKDVIYAYALDDVVFLRLHQENLTTKYTLKELATRLRQPPFFRSHRSFLVNLRRVKEIVPYYNGTCLLVVDDADRSEVPVSRSQARKLKQILGL
jgi:DNA-binding LytR/AlgR family response regulator